MNTDRRSFLASAAAALSAFVFRWKEPTHDLYDDFSDVELTDWTVSSGAWDDCTSFGRCSLLAGETLEAGQYFTNGDDGTAVGWQPGTGKQILGCALEHGIKGNMVHCFIGCVDI